MAVVCDKCHKVMNNSQKILISVPTHARRYDDEKIARASVCDDCKRVHVDGIGFDAFGKEAFMSEGGVVYR